MVLDLRLGGDDGMAIARSLRDQSAIPIVMLTGVRDEADRVMGLELGRRRLSDQTLQPAGVAGADPDRPATH